MDLLPPEEALQQYFNITYSVNRGQREKFMKQIYEMDQMAWRPE